MIERQILAQKLKERHIEEFVFSFLGKLSCSHIKMQRTPLGEKVTIYTSRPGLIVGRRGANIKVLTDKLKTQFNMENPQLEVVEIQDPYLDAASVARLLINGFERFGAKRFKAMAYHALETTMKAGARGIEIVISGRGVPGERAKSWRFSAGYLKKSGDISENYMDRCCESCNLRSGTIGIKVSILHPSVILPDEITQKKITQSAVDTLSNLPKEEIKVEVESADKEEHKKSDKPIKKRTRKSKEKVENGENKEK